MSHTPYISCHFSSVFPIHNATNCSSTSSLPRQTETYKMVNKINPFKYLCAAFCQSYEKENAVLLEQASFTDPCHGLAFLYCV